MPVMPPTMMIGGGGGGGGGEGRGFPGSRGTLLTPRDPTRISVSAFENALDNTHLTSSSPPEVVGRPIEYTDERKYQTKRSSDFHDTGKRVELAELNERVASHLEGGAITARQLALIKSIQSREETDSEKIARLEKHLGKGELPKVFLDEVKEYRGNTEKIDYILRELQKLDLKAAPAAPKSEKQKPLREVVHDIAMTYDQKMTRWLADNRMRREQQEERQAAAAMDMDRMLNKPPTFGALAAQQRMAQKQAAREAERVASSKAARAVKKYGYLG